MNTDSPASLRYRALLQLLRTSDTLWNASHLFFARWDLSPSQFNVLNLLYGLPDGFSQTDLGRELIMHRSNVTGLVDRLEKRGLVERKTVAGDRRAYRVVLTPAGERVMREIAPVYHARAEELWGRISSRQLAELLGHLGEVAQNAERIAREAGSKPEDRADEKSKRRR
jgi:DNA-binding MarR family transcriptional regulator